MITHAQKLDAQARELAKTLLLTEGEVLTVLMEMSRRRLFAELNYTGIFHYCQCALGFSEAQCFYFQKVAHVSVTVPQLKEAVAKGELSVSKARRIAPVITTENQAEWITKAKCLKQKDLEKAVTEVNPQARPIERIKPLAKNVSELKVAIDDETDQSLEVLKNLLSQKLKRPATLADVVAWAVKETREKFDPEKKAQRAQKLSLGKRAANQVTNTTAKASNPPRSKVATGFTPAMMNQRLAVPASVRHEVVREQGVQCSFVSFDQRQCEEKKWLDLHHVIPVSHGGLNLATNLKFLCHSHHRAVHGKENTTP